MTGEALRYEYILWAQDKCTIAGIKYVKISINNEFPDKFRKFTFPLHYMCKLYTKSGAFLTKLLVDLENRNGLFDIFCSWSSILRVAHALHAPTALCAAYTKNVASQELNRSRWIDQVA